MTPLARILHVTALMSLILWLILPLVPLAVWSAAYGWRFPDLLPKAWTPNSWAYALSAASGVPGSLGLSIGISVAVTALAIIFGVPAGRALGLYSFSGKPFVFVLILMPTIVPGLAAAFGLQMLFTTLGLSGSVGGVILAHLIPTLPYMILVMAGIFANYGPSCEQQARSLGAAPLQVFRHITLPAILPGVAIGALFAFLVSWSQYTLTLVIGGGQVKTLPLALFNFAASGRHDIAGAIAVIYLLPGLAVLALTARRITGQGAATAGLGRL